MVDRNSDGDTLARVRALVDDWRGNGNLVSVVRGDLVLREVTKALDEVLDGTAKDGEETKVDPNHNNDIDALLKERTEIDSDMAVLRSRQRAVEARVDALRLAERPTFPTPAQVQGIAEAAKRIKARTPNISHGDSVGQGREVLASLRENDGGWISVQDLSPTGLATLGSLWRFTTAEERAILDLVREQGLVVDSHWRHGDGISITVTVGREGSNDE